jgi:hypothetical protein
VTTDQNTDTQDTVQAPKTAPPVGTAVQYVLTAQDAAEANQDRAKHFNFTRTLGAVLHTGHVGRVGNTAHEGDVCAATVLRVFNEASPTVNLRVHLDGNDDVWRTSAAHGNAPGNWHYIGEYGPDQTS